jgi:hypothetical protein
MKHLPAGVSLTEFSSPSACLKISIRNQSAMSWSSGTFFSASSR